MPAWGDLGIRGLAVAPIYAGERLHGYLFAGQRSPYRFSEEERHLLTAICHHIGLGARNADLYALEREQVRRLREIERLKTDFFNNVSHDLLTPLGAVTTATGLLVSDRDSRLSPLATSLLANIERNAERLNVMVKDLLEVARIQSGRITLKRARVDAGVILRDAVDAVAPQFKAKGQHLDVQSPAEMTPLWVDGDRLERVLVNLLQNAHTHTPAGGKVSVVVDQPDGVVRFAVHDTGPGIEPDQRERVFERFYRPEGSAARSGAGLGLSIAKTIVELHGGTISVESSPGAGASFIVEVPVGAEGEDEDPDC
jgi:signal transduction histidine kinase